MSEGAEGFSESGAGEAGDLDAVGGDEGIGLLFRLVRGFFLSQLGAHVGNYIVWYGGSATIFRFNTTLVQLKEFGWCWRSSDRRCFNTTLVQLKGTMTSTMLMHLTCFNTTLVQLKDVSTLLEDYARQIGFNTTLVQLKG